jgi:hypothetical protein
MQRLDLSGDEAAALVALLTSTIDGDRYRLSPRIRTVKAIRAELRPEPVREPLSPPKVYSPPKARAARRCWVSSNWAHDDFKGNWKWLQIIGR